MKTDLIQILEKALVGKIIAIRKRKPARVTGVFMEDYGYGYSDDISGRVEIHLEGRPSTVLDLQENFEILDEK